MRLTSPTLVRRIATLSVHPLTIALAVCFASVPMAPLRGQSPEVGSSQAPQRFVSQLQPPGTELSARDAMVKLIRSVRIPAEVEGMITELKVEEGNNVDKDQVVAVIDDKQAQLTLKLKEAEVMQALLAAENDVNLRDAVASEASARAEYKSYEEMLRSGALPFWEVEKKRLDAERQKLRIELAELETKQNKVALVAKKQEKALAEFEIERRQVKAPFAGYIETRQAQLGEWVQPGAPIVEVVQMDRVRVEGDIDALTMPEAVVVGAPVKIRLLVSRDEKQDVTFDARIDFVSAQVDVNGQRRIWVDVENQQQNGNWLIKPGMRATITLQEAPNLASR